MPYFDLWTHRIKITLPAAKVDSDVLNPVVPVKLDSTALASLHNVLGSGLTNRKKCAFANASYTYYYAEIKDWTTGCFFVATDTLSSVTDNIFYLYFSASADDSAYTGDAGGTAAQSAWGSNTKSAYNFEQDPAVGTLTDSTGERDGTPGGSMTSGDLISGDYGNAWAFDGSDDYIDLGNGPIGLTGNFTIIFMVNPHEEGDGRVFSTMTGSPNYGMMLMKGGNEDFGLDISSDGTTYGSSKWSAYNFFTVGSYVVGALVYDGSNLKIYKNGSESIGGAYPVSWLNGVYESSGQEIRIATSDLYPALFEADYCHLSIHDAARPAGWVSVFSDGLNNDLLTFGAIESADTIRELIITNIKSNLENMTTANGYNTDAGNSVVRSDEIGELTGLPGIAIDIKQDEPADEQIYGYDVLNMPITISVADTYTFGGTIAANKLVVSQKGEQLLGDIRKAMAQTVTLAKSVVYVNGGIEDYPLQRENEFSVLVKADFNINYETLKNDPYNQ